MSEENYATRKYKVRYNGLESDVDLGGKVLRAIHPSLRGAIVAFKIDSTNNSPSNLITYLFGIDRELRLTIHNPLSSTEERTEEVYLNFEGIESKISQIKDIITAKVSGLELI